MTPAKKSTPDKKNVTTIRGDVVDSVIVTGDNNQTIIQKFFNIFKSDAETLEQRNRRILLGHVENAWIKGVLDASLHGAALLDLGIKQDPEAVTQYPWTLKKESTDEALPAGTSMLEIFDSIGMGRSLLILGAPGSGKTTMLLELARGLIARAREDVTQPIPMVFNLASWTEKLTLADWLAQELNNLYSVPRKTAPDWMKGNKLLLLLDGLDEVRQDSRAKCVEAINEFRKQNGLTSLAVCSRSQDYADLKAKLSFEGAIEVQPLTQEQITEFFNRFGNEMAGIKQALEKDDSLREMAETPLFLSIMLMAYRDKNDVEILISGDEKTQRKHLFDTYIERIFERPRSKNMVFKKQDVLHWLSWLADKMIDYNQSPYLLENMQTTWVSQNRQWSYRMINGLISGLVFGVFGGLIFVLGVGLIAILYVPSWLKISELFVGLGIGGTTGAIVGSVGGLILRPNKIETVDALTWYWKKGIKGFIIGLVGVVMLITLFNLSSIISSILDSISGSIPSIKVFNELVRWLFGMLNYGLSIGLIFGFVNGLIAKQITKISYPKQRIFLSTQNFFIVALSLWSIIELVFVLVMGSLLVEPLDASLPGLLIGEIMGLGIGIKFGAGAVIQHYVLCVILARNNLLPWRLVPFLDHCVDLIFLRRVGGGYIFIHRLLMEHFAEMYVESPTSKGN